MSDVKAMPVKIFTDLLSSASTRSLTSWYKDSSMSLLYEDLLLIVIFGSRPFTKAVNPRPSTDRKEWLSTARKKVISLSTFFFFG